MRNGIQVWDRCADCYFLVLQWLQESCLVKLPVLDATLQLPADCMQGFHGGVPLILHSSEARESISEVVGQALFRELHPPLQGDLIGRLLPANKNGREHSETAPIQPRPDEKLQTAGTRKLGQSSHLGTQVQASNTLVQPGSRRVLSLRLRADHLFAARFCWGARMVLALVLLALPSGFCSAALAIAASGLDVN